MIGAGSKIIGDIHIGDDAKIGAGSVVVNDVPPQGIAIGPKAQILIKNKPEDILNLPK
jgi:serine O-acetyltransferase